MFNETQVRKAILEAAKMHEESWNNDVGEYLLEIEDAVKHTVSDNDLPETIAPLLYLALSNPLWNDSLAYARGEYDEMMSTNGG